MRNRDKAAGRATNGYASSRNVDILALLVRTGKAGAGSLSRRVQDTVISIALELDVIPGKLDKAVGLRTLAQILLEDLLDHARAMPETGWKVRAQDRDEEGDA